MPNVRITIDAAGNPTALSVGLPIKPLWQYPNLLAHSVMHVSDQELALVQGSIDNGTLEIVDAPADRCMNVEHDVPAVAAQPDTGPQGSLPGDPPPPEDLEAA